MGRDIRGSGVGFGAETALNVLGSSLPETEDLAHSYRDSHASCLMPEGTGPSLLQSQHLLVHN